MRILAVTPYYAPEGGGLEQYAHAILGRLARWGHEVESLAFTRLGLADTRPDGVQVHRTMPMACLGNAPVHLGFLAQVRDRIRAARPDLVVGHTPVPFPAEMAFLAARRERVPFVGTYHAGMMRGSSPLLASLAAVHHATFERPMIAGADHLIAVGPYVRDHALRRRSDVTVVAPGVDAVRFDSVTPPEGAGILFVAPLARSYAWKGVDVLWRAFPLVRACIPDATLTLVGGGDRLEEFRQRAAPLERAVRVLGRVPGAQLVDEYRRAAVVVLPSTTDAEAFGMVLAEANACRRPVVASAIGGIPDFVQHGNNGLLACPGDAKDLAAKLIQVLADPVGGRDMGARGRSRVLAAHDWDELARRTQATFEGAVANARRPEAPGSCS